MPKKNLPAIFLDRDGVVIYDYQKPCETQPIKVLSGVEKLADFVQKGYLLIIVSNQSAVAKGSITDRQMWKIDSRMRNLLNKKGVKISASYYCPHHPDYSGDCLCRKPRPGLFFQALAEWNINLQDSWAIGDQLRDLEAAASAGIANTILVKTNQEFWSTAKKLAKISWKADDIKEALKIIADSLK